MQIRDENHRPIPGIQVGDCGPKLGDGANDTGFLRLDGVRIPREFMLSKFQHVTADGKYVKSKKKSNDKLGYFTMVRKTLLLLLCTAANDLSSSVQSSCPVEATWSRCQEPCWAAQ